jgi:hypothetical protein
MNQDIDHEHDWHSTTNPKMLICSCDMVVKISTLIENSRKEGKIATLSALLINRELKKEAHDKHYAWVMSQKNSIPKQESLL